MPDPLFQKLFTDTQQLRPAPVAQVAARGRQRTRRQRLSIVAAALVLAVPVGTAVVLRPQHGGPNVVASVAPEPTGSPTPSAAPTPGSPSPRQTSGPATPTTPSDPGAGSSAPTAPKLTSVPAAALLRADDLAGSGWTASDDEHEGDGGLAPVIGYCPAAGSLPSAGDPVHKRWRSFHRGEGQSGVTQKVLLMPRGGGQKFYDYYRQGAAVCTKTVVYGAEVTVTVVAQGFAGARSMLIRTSSGPGSGELHGVVVHGELASEFTIGDGSEAAGRQLGAKVRTRLCQATQTC